MNPAHTNPASSVETLMVSIERAYGLRLENPERCIEHSRSLLEQAQGFPRAQGMAWRNIGVAQFLKAEYLEALAALLQGANLARNHDDSNTLRDCLNFIGAVYANLGDVATAIENVQATLELDRQSGRQNGIISGLNNLGILHLKLKRPTQALEYHRQALSLAQELSDAQRELETVANIGLTLLELGQLEEARATFNQAHDLALTVGDRVLEGRNLSNLVEALTKLHLFDEALETNTQAIALIREIGNQEGEAHCLLNAGRIHLLANDPQQAIVILEHALVLGQAVGAQVFVFQAHQVLAEAFEASGNLRQALDHTRTSHRLEHEFRNSESEQRLQAFAVRHDLDRARSQAEIERLKNVELAGLLETLRQLDREKDDLLAQLRQQSRELEWQVNIDPLTKLHNRRYLEQALKNEFENAQAHKQDLPVAIIDIDSFKRVNDTFGHAIGDQVLQTVAQIMQQHTRKGDLLARFGGEEFVIVLPRTSQEQAMKICERLRTTIAEYDWASIRIALSVTISLGMNCSTELEDHEQSLSRADLKLYEAKRGGRNRLVC
jgi:diguanylate cyclase (GGDEF)-like protein